MAYYNENDKFSAAWLRELIKAGHIAQGEVDERSIADVRPNDLRGYSQHHFFAGVGLWSRALRLAGWPDSRPVWTGSCPCQSFSNGGKRKGFADERHLWPAFFHLIAECKPSVVFGEQVKDAIKFGWLDVTQNDLEGIGYKTWAHGVAACNLGAPHQRQRLFFVADSGSERERHEPRRMGAAERQAKGGQPQAGDKAEDAQHGGAACVLGDSQHDGLHGVPELDREKEEGRLLEPQGSGVIAGRLGDAHSRRQGLGRRGGYQVPTGEPSEAGGMADPDEQRGEPHGAGGSEEGEESKDTKGRYSGVLPSGGSPTRGFWADAEWLWFKDEKYRPVEPGVSPLVDGRSSGVGRVRDPGAPFDPNATAEARAARIKGYGNAIVPQAAEAFIRTFLMPHEEPLAVLSTFLHPGSKQWFLPHAEEYFRTHPCQTFVEPFSGSGIVGLSLLGGGIVERLVLVENDPRIACLLRGLLDDPTLADRYEAFECTRTNVEALLRDEQGAFRWLVQNRCSRRGGLDGGLRTPIDGGYCREAVAGNIRRVQAMRDRIEVIEGDGLEVMRQYAGDRNVGCFADPPHSMNPRKLFSVLAGWQGPWLLTEDNSLMVRRLASCYSFSSQQALTAAATDGKSDELVLWRKRNLQ
jgi:DNA (cytosine-5)-methyltransferase 1